MTRADISIRETRQTDQKAWDNVVDHPLQSWAWGEFRRSMGIDVVRLAVSESGKLIEGWQLTFHKIPYTSWTIGYFPKGPAPGSVMTSELSKLGKNKRAIFIQFEPNVQKISNLNFQISNLLRPSHHPLFTQYTFVLNLTKSADELLSAMHAKTRYNIKVAQKHGITIAEDDSNAAFAAYLRLTKETTGRQGFYAHNATYHRKMWETMHQAGIARLFTATYQNEIVSVWIVFIWKDTIYYPYGASSRKYREVMAPNLMLWEIANWAKKRGLKYFDLWGALGSTPDPHDPWFGFHRFKAGYNPTLIEFIGSFDLAIQPFLYRLYTVADSLRWTFLKLKRRF